MENNENKIKPGEVECLNKNCWLVKSLDYAPYKRCQYCDLKFKNCMFLQYQIISVVLIVFFLVLSFLISGRIPELVIISVFTLAIVYGYFFNKSTDKIIKANFSERRAKESLEELNKNLERRVNEQTREIRKAYEVEKRANQELKRLDEAKTQFSLATQHHLRTPLTSMAGYLDLLLGGTYGKVSGKIKEVLKKFSFSTNSEIKIVNELLDISQFQMGKEIVFIKDDVRVGDIVKEAISDVKLEAEKKGIALNLDIPENLPTIKGDLQKLKVAIYNIIDNAVKYTQKGSITITIHNTNSKLLITVKDTGAGIPKEFQRDMFNKVFERGEDAMKMFATGRGIGLFITSKIITSHKGKIWAESEGDGKGSTFFIELPS
jgi:signal transduction histidine kinase